MKSTKDLNELIDELIATAQDLVLMEDCVSELVIKETENELLIIKNQIMEKFDEN